MISKLRIFTPLMASLVVLMLSAGCSIHQPDIQQGNSLDEKNISQLREGMKRSEVRYLMGTPMITDPFHENRWDYIYTYQTAGEDRKMGRVTLWFDNDKVARIDKKL